VIDLSRLNIKRLEYELFELQKEIEK